MQESCGKILREILVGKSCGKFMRKNLVGNLLQEISYWKILQENLVGNSCGKFLGEKLLGLGRGKKVNLRKAVIGGNLAFGIG